MAASARFFSADDTSPAHARRWVSRVLVGWRVPEDTSNDVLLVVSELATNAVIHAKSDFLVVVHQAPDTLGVAVADDHREVPTPRTPSPKDVGGRGLRMVHALARLTGVERVPGDGKVVWAQLAR
jgi:anti-sigma regulatory factor (Ser/Thr protein kinase)